MKQSELNKILANPEKLNLQGANLKGANLKGANLKGAYLKGANLSGANLSGANLKGAYLEEANLKGAYLERANLEESYLEGAYLVGAHLEKTEIFTFQCFRDFGFYHRGKQYKGGDYLQIGCSGYSLQQWINHYIKIGEANNYTKTEMELYYKMMLFIQKNIKNE